MPQFDILIIIGILSLLIGLYLIYHYDILNINVLSVSAIKKYRTKKLVKQVFLTAFGLLLFFMGSKPALITTLITEYKTLINFLIAYVAAEYFSNLVSCLVFTVKHYKNKAFWGLKKSLLNLPLFNKLCLIGFTMIYAIPNKIIINNKLSPKVISFIVFLIIVLSHFFLPVLFIYILFWVKVIESFIFAKLYKNNITFSNFINKHLFNNNTSFSSKYFNFFWGNMTEKSFVAGTAGAAGSVASTLYILQREREKVHVRKHASKETEEIIRDAENKPQTVQDVLKLRKEVEEHVTMRDTYALKGEAVVTKTVQKISDWLNN